jgi:hypothetical protein
MLAGTMSELGKWEMERKGRMQQGMERSIYLGGA